MGKAAANQALKCQVQSNYRCRRIFSKDGVKDFVSPAADSSQILRSI